MSDGPSPWWLLLSLAIRIAWCIGTANLAESKGRSSIAGGVAGFFLGIIGYGIFYFLPALDGQPSDRTPRAPMGGTEAKRQQFGEVPAGTCRVCGYANAPRESRCYQCGNMMA